jgi:hypothetical protein
MPSKGATRAAGDPDRRIAPLACDYGAIVHGVIGELLAAGDLRPTPERIVEIVGRNRSILRVSHYRMAAVQQAWAGAAIYFHYFLPDPSWSFAGAEVVDGRARFDLVWRNGPLRLIDELKLGRVTSVTDKRSLDAQIARYREAGRDRWSEHFSGLRVILLGAPARSFVVERDGERRPLLDDSTAAA